MAEPNLTEHDYELLSAYLDGELSDAERSALEARLNAEAALRRELSALRQTVALVNRLPALKAPRDFTLDAARLQPRVIPYPQPRRRFNINALTAVAAMVVVVLFAGVIMTALLGPAIGNIFSNTVMALQGGGESGGMVAALSTALPPSPTLPATSPGLLEDGAGYAPSATSAPSDEERQEMLATDKLSGETPTGEGDTQTLTAVGQTLPETALVAPAPPSPDDADTAAETAGAFRESPTQIALYAPQSATPTEQVADSLGRDQVGEEAAPMMNLAAAPTASPEPESGLASGVLSASETVTTPTSLPTTVAMGGAPQPPGEQQRGRAASLIDNAVLVVIVVTVGLLVVGTFVVMRRGQG